MMNNNIINIQIGTTKGKDTAPMFGQFIEHALDCIEGGVYDPHSIYADKTGIREDVADQVKSLNPPIIRFPGGTVMCQYHWEDAIGPVDERIWRKNLIWGGELDPSFGTAEFVMFCRKVSAEPMICVNMESGTPEEAGNWVEYCNSTGNGYYAQLRRKHGYEEPFGVKYWCIGNESFSKYDMGIHHDVNIYTRDAMEFIKRMKLTDPAIKTIVVGCDEENWNKPVLDALHEVTDYFSLHHYSSTDAEDIYEPYYGEMNLKKMLDEVSGLIDTYPDKVIDFNRWYRFPPREEKIKIAVDEWNIWDFKEDETYGLKPVYCWRDALWVASALNLFISHEAVGMANMAQLVNVLAPIRTEEDRVWLQTIAYPLIYYRKYMTGNVLDVTCDDIPKIIGREEIPALSISAVEHDNIISVAVVNRDTEHSYTLKIHNTNSGSKKLESVENIEMLILDSNAWNLTCSVDHSCVNIRNIIVEDNMIECPKASICLVQYSLLQGC